MTNHSTQLTFKSRRLRTPAALVIVAVAALLPVRATAANTAEPPTVKIAIVKDGSSSLIDDLEASVRAEALALTAGRANLVFTEGDALNAGWRDGAAQAALDAALSDDSIDYAFVFGVRVTAAAADADHPLNKPVLGAIIQEPDLLPLPVDADGHSTKANFAVVALPSRTTDQLAELRTAVPFDSLQLLVDPFFAPNGASLEAWRVKIARQFGVPVAVVPFDGSASEALTATGSGTVLLLPAVRMDGPERAALLQGLTARKISVLSYLGQSEVEAGALAGVMPNPRAALVRRLAINLDQLISGASVGDLQLRADAPHQLYLNESVAEAVGVSPGFEALNRAVIFGGPHEEEGRAITFTGAMTAALDGNFGLRAQEYATESSRQSVRSAQGTLMPQVAATQNYSRIDGDRAAASGGAQPEASYRAGVSISQTIFDDEAFTRVKIAREAKRQADYYEEVERLNTVHDAGQAYLQLLSAQASLRVAEENYNVTLRNLELARLRERVGTSGPEEGFRFESLAAQQRAELVAAHSQVDSARVALNHELGVDVGTRWQAADVSLADPAFSLTTGRVIELVNDRRKLDRFRAFVASYAAAHSPDIAAIEHGVDAQRLSAGEKKRRRYTPKVSASFSYSHLIDSESGGPSLAEQFAAAGVPVQVSTADRDDWSFGVTATIPLFSGGTLAAESRKARADLQRAEFARDDARHAVMAQAQSALFAVESAYQNIALSHRAADLAAQNLAVVQEKYEQGTVSIVTLLDAQNSAFAQRHSAEAAVYQFFSRLLQFQRALGWVEALATPAEKEAWVHQVEQAVSS